MHDAEPKSAGASDADVHVASLDEIKGYTGIEFLRRIASGEVAQPPIAKTLGFRPRRGGAGLRAVHHGASVPALQSDRQRARRRGRTLLDRA